MKIAKNQYIRSFICGCLGALAFAPFHFFIAAIISISGFFWFIQKSTSNKQAFYLGLTYGYGYFLAGLYWITISLLVDAERFAWLIPFCLTLIPLILALYLGLLAMIFKKIITRFDMPFYSQILLFSLLWVFFESLRGLLLSGFPWNLLGYSLLFDLRMVQSANIIGIYGLSLVASLFCLIPILFYKTNRNDKIFASFLIAIFITNFAYGHWRLQNTTLNNHDDFKIRIVQANIKQDLKWDQTEKYRSFLRHIAISSDSDSTNVKAVIWSETSVPYVIDNNPELLDLLKRAINNSAILITGGLRGEYKTPQKLEIKQYWNSVFAVDKTGIVGHYDKHHLVPFGEYIPFTKFLPFLEKITGGDGGFSAGEGPATLQTQHFSFSPLICYEVIFSGAIIDKSARPDLLVNVTNDAWFGTSTGPYQHFDSAIMRSVEYGISLARAANTGISAYIDPVGNIRQKITLNQEGFVDAAFVEKIAPTMFSRFGYMPLALIVAVIALFIVITIFRKK